MANLWHSSAVLFLIKNKLFPIIVKHLVKDNNLIDFTTFTFINDEKLQKIINNYFTVDEDEVNDRCLYNECHGVLFGTESDSIFVYLKAKNKNFKVVVSDYHIIAYKEMLGNDCITIFDIILDLYNQKKLSKENLIDIMGKIKENTKNPVPFTTIQAYKDLTTLIH